jgi:hypothetical protein
MKIIIMSLLFASSVLAQTTYPDINKEIENGNFTKASSMIDEVLKANNLSLTEEYELNFQKERLDRIKLDFRRTSDDVVEYVRKYYPDAGE